MHFLDRSLYFDKRQFGASGTKLSLIIAFGDFSGAPGSFNDLGGFENAGRGMAKLEVASSDRDSRSVYHMKVARL